MALPRSCHILGAFVALTTVRHNVASLVSLHCTGNEGTNSLGAPWVLQALLRLRHSVEPCLPVSASDPLSVFV